MSDREGPTLVTPEPPKPYLTCKGCRWHSSKKQWPGIIYHFCQAKSQQRFIDMNTLKTPDWCPLRSTTEISDGS